MRQAYRLLALLLIGMLSWACDSRSSWEGRYVGQAGKDPAGTVTLVMVNQSGEELARSTDCK